MRMIPLPPTERHAAQPPRFSAVGWSGGFDGSFLQLSYPNVAIADGIPVVLEHQRFLEIVFLI